MLALAATLTVGVPTAAAGNLTFGNPDLGLQDHLFYGESTLRPPERNNVQIGIDPAFPDDLLITDFAGIQDPIPPNCHRVSSVSVRCPAALVRRIAVFLGGENDSFSVSDPPIPASTSLEVEGGEGDDRITGRGGAGQDDFDGGNGRDYLSKDPDAPFTRSAAPRSVFPAAAAPTLGTLSGGPGNDQVLGGPANDLLNGDAGRDKLVGRAGNDRMFGGPGVDHFSGGPGRDFARGGGGNDRGSGGAGNDNFRD